ncbi:TRAP transporter substrate-binding protein [Vibrio salinus]|uniref:TRAP transporter substrate-binding protein n=1 Tax=Vibrio salinus TaxID=2899784 RepID=UPI001E45A2B1|nr:TRAP transporter substrate-binding protein [Vibrio salinus]MCE0496078.1 TRAP transporter substrate-binding protein [Vibrio salinus]
MKKLLVLCVNICFMLVVAKSYAAPLIVAHELPAGHPVSQSIDWFASEVDKRTGMEVKVFSDGKLGNETALLKALQDGSIAVTKVGASLITNYSDDYKVLALPYLFKDKAHYSQVLQGPIGKKLLAETNDKGFIGLAFLDAGSRSFYTDKPIVKPADLKGLKIRVQNSSLPKDMVSALGAVPIPIAYSELYDALHSGLVDGAENNIPSFFSSRHYEVKKYYSFDKHSSVPDVLVVSTKIWDTIPESDQSEIRKIAQEMVKVQEDNWSKFVGSAVEKLKASGVKFTESDIPAFQEAVKPVYEKFITEHPGQEELLKNIQNQ